MNEAVDESGRATHSGDAPEGEWAGSAAGDRSARKERARGQRLNLAHYFLLLVVSLGLFLPGFFNIPPIDRDESRYVQASRQMVESGDFVDIRFQQEPRYKKPVGIYWLQSASVLLSGKGTDAPIWVYRIPSLAGAILAVLLTGWVGGRLFGANVGFMAALMIAGSVLLGVEARMAKTDAALLAFVVLAQGALAHIYLSARQGRKTGWPSAAVFWLSVGAGILIKGPVILLPVAGTILFVVATEWRTDWLRRLRPALGVPLMLLPVAPWLIAITIATHGAFFQESVGHDLLGKVLQGQESHGAPPGVYLASFFGTFWPFAILTLLALPWIWRRRRDPAVRFALGWIIPAWLVFEFVSTKLPHYVLPVFPAIAILTAAAALDGFGMSGEPGRVRRWLWRVAVGLFAVVAVALGLAMAVVPWVMKGTPDPWGLLAGVIALGGAALFVYRSQWLLQRPRTFILATVFGVLAFYVPTFQFVIPRLDPVWLSPRVAAAVEEVKPCSDPLIASSGYSEPSLVFLVGTDLRLGSPEEAAATLMERPSCSLAIVTDRMQEDFVAALVADGKTPTRLASIEGFNYSKGDDLSVGIYRLEE